MTDKKAAAEARKRRLAKALKSNIGRRKEAQPAADEEQCPAPQPGSTEESAPRK
jgi:hypothetical protein